MEGLAGYMLIGQLNLSDAVSRIREAYLRVICTCGYNLYDQPISVDELEICRYPCAYCSTYTHVVHYGGGLSSCAYRYDMSAGWQEYRASCTCGNNIRTRRLDEYPLSAVRSVFGRNVVGYLNGLLTAGTLCEYCVQDYGAIHGYTTDYEYHTNCCSHIKLIHGNTTICVGILPEQAGMKKTGFAVLCCV